MDNLATKVTRIISRNDGSEVKLVAQGYLGTGLHLSVEVDVFHRQSPSQNWRLCNDKPHPDWRKMSVDEYVKHGRPEKFQMATHGEILSVASAIGKPIGG